MVTDVENYLRIMRNAAPPQWHFVTEALTAAAAEAYIQHGDCVLDLGANQGYHTATFARAVGEGGLVHAFEPNPIHWPNLSSLPGVRLWPYAVGETLSVRKFYFPLLYEGWASLNDPRDILGDTVETKILDVIEVGINELREVFERTVKFVKIDVERNELRALIGMNRLIERDSPVIVLEGETENIRSFLASFGYRSVQMTYSIWGELDLRLPNSIFIPSSLPEHEVVPAAEVVRTIIEDSMLKFPQ